MARRQLEVSNEVAAELAGSHDSILKTLEEHLDAQVFLRGNVVTLDGEAEAVQEAATVVRELSAMVERGHDIGPATIESVARVLDQRESPATVLEDVVWRHRNLRVAPRSVNQKKYVDAIRRETITFGIGPAGTGKTFLAIAMAVAALSRREVNRIILTRPAVEAGERLGFLPGDLMAKVDPYLRPLFDALNDMLDPEKVSGHLEKGVIEVAPLAFMRGRAQPVDQPVLTPDGWQAIGTLRVGDLVVGSDGRPTPVLGVHPQGRRPVYRVRTQDGASTLACAEHLWHVFTPEDRRRGKPGRVLQTQEMIGRLRRGHQRRYELPLVSAPVEMEPRDVPMEPYALGLLLGDSCITGRTTPTFTTRDPELADALESALDGIELQRKSEVDYVLRHPAGGRGGLLIANPATVALRELGLVGTRSTTKFVPEAYLRNSAAVRLAVLQGLLDADGGPVTQAGRTCRVEYSTCSPRLRDDVLYLVRSLGGVAYWRTLVAEGRPPGLARGRAVEHRHGAYVMDIRLPEGLEPFRLSRKRELYASHGGGRPMRFIDEIVPAGERETVCIQVAAADSLYVTDDFLVTHNTLNDSFVILDEAQNSTPEQMKMFLTRLGFGSKMVVTGDVTQVDLPKDQRSGLLVVGDILDGVEGVEFTRFGGEDVVRHKLVQRIVAAYAEHSERQAPELRPADHRRRPA
ncbi:MAG: phosphate starvation-inducible protein PhoH [Thermoleophilia bacterium]|nr:phosphate starvation-inducible protein PhoH [Thermoleophilia bacterium]